MSVKGLAVADKNPLEGGRDAADSRRRTRNPQGQGARLRADLIAAADRILARTGDLEGLSLRGVAREIGIATPSIYLHFPNKQALVHAVLSARFTELGEAVQAAVQGAVGPPARLQAGCLAYCRFAAEQPGAYRVLFDRTPRRQRPRAHRPPSSASERGDASSDAPPDSESAPATVRQQDLTAPGGYPGAAAFSLLIDSVAACMQAGDAPSRDPFQVATNVWTALHGIVTLRASLPAFPWPPLDRQVDDVVAGIVGLHHNSPPTEG